MSEIISKDAIRAKARAAFVTGRPRDSHGFNWHAPALETWNEEWDLCVQSPSLSQKRSLARDFAGFHSAPAARHRVDQEQAA